MVLFRYKADVEVDGRREEDADMVGQFENPIIIMPGCEVLAWPLYRPLRAVEPALCCSEDDESLPYDSPLLRRRVAAL